MRSRYFDDLSREQYLAQYLDAIYERGILEQGHQIVRNHDVNLQHQGVDLIIKNGDKKFYVDEKAQLDYLGKALMTFAFEISYLKNGRLKQGWLFDNSKITDIYFLVTSIIPMDEKSLFNGISSIKLTGVYRARLIELLRQRGLTRDRLYEYEKEIRSNGIHGRNQVKELNPYEEGVFYYSEYNKAEKPINLVLKLEFLIRNRVAKRLV